MGIFLASYSIKIRNKRSSSFLKFGKFDGFKDFHELFAGYLETLGTKRSHDADAKCLHGTERVEFDGDSVWGLLNSGDYGAKTALVDVKTGNDVFERQENHAELYPYFFYLFAPPNSTQGILIVQRMGNSSILSIFEKTVKDYLIQKYDVIVDISALVPQEVFDIVAKGHLKSVTFDVFQMPSDKASMVDWDPGQIDSDCTMQLVVKPKSGKSLPLTATLKKYISPDRRKLRVQAAAPLSDGEMRVRDEIQVKVDYQGTQRTVVLDDPTKLKPYIDVTPEVGDLVDGHPKFDAIHQCAYRLLIALRAEMGDSSVIQN